MTRLPPHADAAPDAGPGPEPSTLKETVLPRRRPPSVRDPWLWAVVAMGLALRLALLVSASAESVRTPDTQDYLALARALARTGRFARPDAGSPGPFPAADAPAAGPLRPEVFRTPGYPAVLAWACDADTEAGDPPLSAWRGILAGQAVLDSIVVAAVYAMAGLLGLSRGPARLAAGFQAISPLMIAGCCRLVSDSLYAALLAGTLVAYLAAWRARRAGGFALAGVMMGLACYVRPVGLVAGLVLAGGTLLSGKRLAACGAFIAAAGAIVLPWCVRNALVADYVGFSSFGTDAMYYFAAPEVLAEAEGRSGADVRAEWAAAEARDNPGRTVGARARWRSAEARRVLFEHRWRYLRLHVSGSAGVLLPAATDVLEVAGASVGGRGTREVLRREGLISAVRHYFGGRWVPLAAGAALALVTCVRLGGVLLGLTLGGPRRPPPVVWVLAVLVLTAILLPGPFGLPRYRMPVEALFSLAAGWGYVAVWRRRQVRVAEGRSGRVA